MTKGKELVAAGDGAQLAAELKKSKAALTRFLGSPAMASRAATVAYVLVRRTPDLQKCSIESIVNGMLLSAQLGLELGSEAYLVPFKNSKLQTTEAVFIPDWKGLVRLAIRAGSLTGGHGDLVYADDEYVYRQTADGVEFVHERKRLASRAKNDTVKAHVEAGCQGVYFVGHTKEGPPVVAEMTVDDVEYVRKTYSKQPDSPLWTKRWSMAAIKTVAKQALKVVPMSPHLQTAIELDNRAETGIETAVLNGDEEAVAPYQEPKALSDADARDEDKRLAEQDG